MEVVLGGKPLTTPNSLDTRLAILLWGMAGCGKTTLAATAPGKKLWILFDPDGEISLQGRDDIQVLDLSSERHVSMVEKLKSEDPYGIEKYLKDNPDIETVVLDSATALTSFATDNAVHHVKSATIENLGLKGYGHRNAIVLRVLTTFMRMTKRLNRHFIIISHEDAPRTNDDGIILLISLALGGKMTSQVGLQISEIWWMSDTGKERRIAVRPIRKYAPMKSRMFDVSGAPDFVWHYDAVNWKGDGIQDWFNKWKEGQGRKIPLPGSK